MSIAPEDLLTWADSLPSGSEVCCRAAVSRAYYAAYHDCVSFHDALPVPGIAPPHGGVHELLCGRLQNPAPETKDPLRTRSRTRAQFLRALKHMRTVADYYLQDNVDHAVVANAISKARQIMQT